MEFGWQWKKDGRRFAKSWGYVSVDREKLQINSRLKK